MWSVIRGQGNSVFLVWEISNRRKKYKIFGFQGDHQIPSFSGASDLPIKKPLKSVLDSLTVMIFKRVSESIFFQVNNFTACKFKDKKRGGKFFDGIQSTEDYPFISRQEAFKGLVKLKLQAIRIFN